MKKRNLTPYMFLDPSVVERYPLVRIKALHAVEKGQLVILPERFEKDWCISRQVWWGHQIHVCYITGKGCKEEYIIAGSAEEALVKSRRKYGKSVEIYQDPKALDMWFQGTHMQQANFGGKTFIS